LVSRLYPEEEEAAVAAATPRRRKEFATTRAGARRTLARLGLPEVPIGRGAGGCPAWPAGLVGSITHCAGYRAAARAPRRDVASLGIDAEPHRPLRDGLLDIVGLPEERAHVACRKRGLPILR
jgi:enterobactin synthetase component D / holo-[acyl-carrier protein] synthase